MRKLTTDIKISVLTPFFNESENIDDYFYKVIKVLNQIHSNWEIICIDDGSIDETRSELLKFANNNTNIKLIFLSRNFGKEAALTAGLDHASGDLIIPIDADLQDPPEVIPYMIEKWEQGYDIINGVRKSRYDGFFRRFTAYIFYKIINFLTNGKIPEHVGDFRLIDRKALEIIKNLREKTRYMKGVISWVGYKSTVVEYYRPQRNRGLTKLNFLKLLKHAYDGIFSFSSKPLKIWLYLGLIFSFSGFTYACYLVIKVLLYGIELPGYTSLMVVIIFIGGIQLISLGIIGEYIARIFKEVKNRPIYIVDEIVGINASKFNKRK